MKLMYSLLLSALAACHVLAGGELKTLVYPSLIYDDARCPVYRDYATDLTFLFFYNGDRPIRDLAASGSKLEIEMPSQLKLQEANVMDGWKKPNSRQTLFPNTAIKYDNIPYTRYTIKLPGSVLQPALKKPLPGGMFGGTTNNLAVLLVKPEGKLPDSFKIRWRTVGKYQSAGEFTAYPVALPAKEVGKIRTELRSHAPLVNLGYSDAALENMAKIFRHSGIRKVDAQLPDGPNRGNRKIWEKYGFSFYGGNSLMHVLIRGERGGSDNEKDYLVGIDGKRARNIDGRAYHNRIWCPTAAVTPGRIPWKMLIATGKADAAQGASAIDADFETHIWSHCFCPDCRRAFFAFAKLPPEELKPLELMRKYPLEWYKFRCEQTRQLYEQLRRELKPQYPDLQLGVNAINHHFENDLGELKYGMCDFAEDPRLLQKSIDYILADTLVGGLYDAISVDVLAKSTGKPIIAVPGASYCVDYSHSCMAGRRMSAELSGENYGYDKRPEFHKLAMLHFAASGATGLRYSLDDAAVTRAAAEGAALLGAVEDFYLDGKRGDAVIAVADLTQGESPWRRDNSRVRGKIWRTYYDRYNGHVQSRAHVKDGELLISLFNWDPFQTKRWHVALKQGDFSGTLLDAADGKRLTADGKNTWSNADLRCGFAIEVPPAGFRLLRLTRKNIANKGDAKLQVTPSTVPPYNQYAWYKGGQLNPGEMAEEGLRRPLKQIKEFGGKKAAQGGITSRSLTLPFSGTFSPLPAGVIDWGNNRNGALFSNGKYCFAAILLPKSDGGLQLELNVRGGNGATFGVTLHEQLSNNVPGPKALLRPFWGRVCREKAEKLTIAIPAELSGKPSMLMLYNLSRRGECFIDSMTAKKTEAAK